MKSITALKTVLAATASIVVFVSCTEEYPLIWNVQTDKVPSSLRIEMDFVVPGKYGIETVALIPGQTEVIRLRQGYQYLAHEHPGSVQLYTYPRLSQITPGRRTEIFVYSVEVEELGIDQVLLSENSAAVAYYVRFYSQGSDLTVISADPLVERTPPRPKIPIAEMIESLSVSQYAFEEEGIGGQVDTGIDYGYIAQSKIDGSYHWLGSGGF